MTRPRPRCLDHRLSPLSVLLIAALATCALAAGTARAESGLLFDYPKDFGEIPAATYDGRGRRVGDASVTLTRLDDGLVRIEVQSGIDRGARNELESTLEEVSQDGRRWLRPVHQRSQSFDAKGKPLVILEIDHRNAQARCTPPDGAPQDAAVVPLPENDRVVNVPMNLFFAPLVRGDIEQLDYRVFFCLGGPRVIDFGANMEVLPIRYPDTGVKVRRVNFGPEGASFMSWIAKTVTPQLAFWFDDGPYGGYIAHRMPLYSRGPDVIIVRDGFPVSLLLGDAR